MNQQIKIIKGDITTYNGDIIVNAANNRMLGGGGVDGAIHRAAGSALKAACAKHKGCKTGHAKVTDGYRLRARYVIHTVGPVWKGGDQSEARLLLQAYLSSFYLAKALGQKKIAFPAISTGAYGFPLAAAAKIVKIAVDQVSKEYEDYFDEIAFYCFDERMYTLYQNILQDSSS